MNALQIISICSKKREVKHFGIIVKLKGMKSKDTLDALVTSSRQ